MRQFLSGTRKNQAGFAIILVMGLLLVAATVTATLMARQDNEVVWEPIKGTQHQLASVQEALIAFQRKNHRLPRPAVRTNRVGNHVNPDLVLHDEIAAKLIQTPSGELPPEAKAVFEAGGKSASPELLGGIAIVTNSDKPLANPEKDVLVGAIPTKALGLPFDAAVDKNGRLLTYAVTKQMTDPNQFANAQGAIDLDDVNGNPVGKNLPFLVLALGKGGKGAWSAKSRTRGRECDGTVNSNNRISGEGSYGPVVSDFKNCEENDAKFIAHDVSLVVGDGAFDDQLLKGDKDTAALSQSRPCGPQQVRWGAGGVCTADIPPPGLMHIGSGDSPRELTLTHTAPGATGSVKVTCNNASVVQADAVCNVSPTACPLPWGGTINKGESVTAYQSLTGSCESPCQSQTRTCQTNGTLSGTFTNATCTAPDITCEGTCALPWGGTINDGQTVVAWQNNVADSCNDICHSETRECIDGTLKGSYEHASCTVPVCPVIGCTTPWGTSVAEGTTVTAYNAKVNCCDAQTRVCRSGQWETTVCASSGALGDEVNCLAPFSAGFNAATCPFTQSEGGKGGGGSQPVMCSAPGTTCPVPDSLGGGSINVGQSVTAFASANGTCAQNCQSQTRTCQANGTLSGSFTVASCTAATNCGGGTGCSLPWGGTLAHNASVAAFEASSVDCGISCNSQQRVCTNGVLSGSFTHQSCSAPNNCASNNGSCNSVHGMTSNGGTLTTYEVNHGYLITGGNCPQPRISRCTNGQWDVAPFAFTTCNAWCLAPDGLIISGGNATTYSARSVPPGQSCSSIERTSLCANGVFSPPALTFARCGVSCVNPFGGTVEPDETMISYTMTTAPSGQSCGSIGVAVTSTCTNGALSPAPAQYASCSAPSRPCTNPFNGDTIAHNATIDSYSENFVPMGLSCNAVRVTSRCLDSVLTPEPELHESCSVGSGASCNNPHHIGGVTQSGASITTYEYSSGCDAECMPVTSNCVNGNWDSTPANHSSCTVTTNPCR